MIVVNRADLYYALDAVTPHLGNGKTAELELVLASGRLLVHGTDNYTAGIATVPLLDSDSGGLHAFLATGEAKELLRHVRPGPVADREQDVTLAEDWPNACIHVANGEDQGEMFDASGGTALCSYRHTLALFAALQRQPLDNHHQVYDPKLLGRFEKARFAPTDHMRIQPHLAKATTYGVALVAVGDRFIGSIAGISYEWGERAPSPDFLLAELLDRPIRKVS